MSRFVFKEYQFDKATGRADFVYKLEGVMEFKESVQFIVKDEYNEKLLDKALFLAFIILGTSYYKTFPSRSVIINYPIDIRQAAFFSRIYQEGMSQFAFENDLTRNDLARFFPVNENDVAPPIRYNGSGVLVMQSGGKDSLLSSCLLHEKDIEFSSIYISSNDSYPKILDEIIGERIVVKRVIDIEGLKKAQGFGAKNGHVPVTYINQSLALVQAILLGKNTVLSSIAHEGEEPNGYIGELPINHQWSKTWFAEQIFADYVNRYISIDIKVGSILRRFSELEVAETFAEKAWEKFGRKFSSCNIANYKQGNDSSELSWCGNCPKCANSYLLFAPFLPVEELKAVFGGVDLFTKPELQQTFKGLLGIDDEPKPLECVGEVEELRAAYHMSQSTSAYGQLSFDVPESYFDYLKIYPAQDWALQMLQ